MTIFFKSCAHFLHKVKCRTKMFFEGNNDTILLTTKSGVDTTSNCGFLSVWSSSHSNHSGALILNMKTIKWHQYVCAINRKCKTASVFQQENEPNTTPSSVRATSRRNSVPSNAPQSLSFQMQSKGKAANSCSVYVWTTSSVLEKLQVMNPWWCFTEQRACKAALRNLNFTPWRYTHSKAELS